MLLITSRFVSAVELRICANRKTWARGLVRPWRGELSETILGCQPGRLVGALAREL